jgi:hypothetical protein
MMGFPPGAQYFNPQAFYQQQAQFNPMAYPPLGYGTPSPVQQRLRSPSHEEKPKGPSKEEEQIKRLEAMFIQQRKEQEEKDAKREADEKAKIAAQEAAVAKAAADKAAAAKRAKEDEELAATAAAKAKEAAEKAAKEAADKKEEEAAAAAKAAEAKAAAEKAAAAKPKPQKPIKFKDAVGRKFSFPFHLCKTWAVSISTPSFLNSTEYLLIVVANLGYGRSYSTSFSSR